MSPERSVGSWLERIDWLWTIVGGFYLIAYLYWYLPALARLPRSLRHPPEGFPWHWSLDLVVTGVTGTVLVFLGFRRATELSAGRGGRRSRSERGGDGGRSEANDRPREATRGESRA